MNIRYFFVGNVQRRRHINIVYCPTDEMIGDFFTKPLGGAKFWRFRNIIMNITHNEYGPVAIDELTAIHNAKVEKRIEMNQHQTDREDGESVLCAGHQVSGKDTVSQECVGHVRRLPIKGSKYKSVSGEAHRINGGKTTTRTYAQVVSE